MCDDRLDDSFLHIGPVKDGESIGDSFQQMIGALQPDRFLLLRQLDGRVNVHLEQSL